MKHRRNRGFKGIAGFFKELAYNYERCKLEEKWYVCSPMQEYFNSHPDEEEEHDISYGKELAKLNKKYGKQKERSLQTKTNDRRKEKSYPETTPRV